MKFDSGTKTRLFGDLVLTFDPTGSTVELLVDGTSYAATWLSTPVASTVNGVQQWAQTAQTTTYFAGPGVASPGGGTVVLAAGVHSFEARITSGSDIIETPLRPAAIVVSD